MHILCSNGGNIWADDALLINAKKSEVSILNSTFTDNKDSYPDSIHELIELMDANLMMDNTIFSNNSLNVISASSKSNLIIQNSIFKNNSAVIQSSGNIDVINSSFVNNGPAVISYKNLNVSGSKFMDNLQSTQILYYGAKVTIKNSEFKNNNAEYGAGAIDGYGNLMVIGSNFTQNRGKYANTIYSKTYWDRNERFDNSITLINSTINSISGHAIYGICCNVNLEDTSINSTSKQSDIFINVGSLKENNSRYNYFEYKAKIDANVDASKPKYNVYYYNSDGVFFIGVTDSKTGDNIDNAKIIVKIYTGKKYKTYHLNPRYVLDGEHVDVPIIKLNSKITVGKHKVEIIASGKYLNFQKFTTALTIKKAKTIVKAPKVTHKYKRSKYFKITIKNRITKKIHWRP